MTTFTIEATPLAKGGWTLEVDGVGVSQVRRLDQAQDEMRDAISDITGLDASQFTMTVRPHLDPTITQQLDELEQLQREATQAQERATRERRELAANLAKAHMSVRDIGTIMGVSFQRAGQLLKAS